MSEGMCSADGCRFFAVYDGVCSRHAAIAWREANGLPTLRRLHPPGTRVIDRDGYARVANEFGNFEAEHRVVMREMLGRDLVRGESVHHINGDRADNRPGNLELWFSAQPYGQRVDQLLEYVATVHADSLRDRIGCRCSETPRNGPRSDEQPESGELRA